MSAPTASLLAPLADTTVLVIGGTSGTGRAVATRALDGYAAGVPAGRVGTPDDVATAALFLMSNTWVTGTVLDVDGGVQVV